MSALIQGIRDHGKDWSKLMSLIPTKGKSQIRSMTQNLISKFEKKPDLPGSDILPILKERADNRTNWTEEEKVKLEEGIIKYGRHVQKLSHLIPTQKPAAIRFRLLTMTKAAEKSSDDLDDISKALTTETHKYGSISWTQEETSTLIEAIREHGRNWSKILPSIKSKDYDQIVTHARQLMKKFQKQPELPDADILQILEEKRTFKKRQPWTDKERDDLIAGIREYGKDWVKVTAKVATKNNKAVQHKAERLHQMFKLDPSLPDSDILQILNQRAQRAASQAPDGDSKRVLRSNGKKPVAKEKEIKIKKKEPWSEIEHWKLIEAVRMHETDWDKITAQVGTRDKQEVLDHVQILK